VGAEQPPYADQADERLVERCREAVDQAAFAELRHDRRIDLRGGFEGKEKQAAEQCFHHGAFSSKRGTSLAAWHAILTRGARR